MRSWDPPRLPPRLTASLHVPIVGRQAELAALESVWDEVESGRGQLVFIGGEPGSGKTRLVAEVAGALAGVAAGVLVGTCSRDAGIPYEPFSEVLDELLAGAPKDAFTELLGESSGELARLSTRAARHLSAPADSPLPGGEGRRVLFDAVSGFFRALSETRPLALLLEDLHWSQLPTLALLEHVLLGCRQTRLLVLATFRTTTP
ncbi:MAG TPA: ATP-binding protein, partial [Acidimicrobiales bacterium]|nr:ATP-binding protein [Acidimicrobiales bacterium]